MKVTEKTFPFLDYKQLEKLQALLSDRQNIMAHELAIELSISLSVSIAILTILRSMRICKIRLLVYHKECLPEVPFDSFPFENGFPDLPIYCDECDEYIDSYDALSYDFIAIIE